MPFNARLSYITHNKWCLLIAQPMSKKYNGDLLKIVQGAEERAYATFRSWNQMCLHSPVSHVEMPRKNAKVVRHTCTFFRTTFIASLRCGVKRKEAIHRDLASPCPNY